MVRLVNELSTPYVEVAAGHVQSTSRIPEGSLLYYVYASADIYGSNCLKLGQVSHDNQ